MTIAAISAMPATVPASARCSASTAASDAAPASSQKPAPSETRASRGAPAATAEADRPAAARISSEQNAGQHGGCLAEPPARGRERGGEQGDAEPDNGGREAGIDGGEKPDRCAGHQSVRRKGDKAGGRDRDCRNSEQHRQDQMMRPQREAVGLRQRGCGCHHGRKWPDLR